MEGGVTIQDLTFHTLQNCDMNLKTLEPGFTEDFMEFSVLHQA